MEQENRRRFWMNPNKRSKRKFPLLMTGEIIFEYEQGKITGDEAILLAKIENFVQYASTSRHGIWITNEKLAEYQGVSTRRIEYILSNLRNYLISTTLTTKKGFRRRYLKTIWTDSLRQKRKQKPS